MRILIMIFTVSALLFSSALNGSAQSLWDAGELSTAAHQQLKPEDYTATNYKPGIVRHIVLLRYKPSVSAAQRMAVLERFRNLKHTLLRNGSPYIIAIHAGAQLSHAGLDQEFDQVFIIKFSSEGDRNYYIGPPVVTNPAYYDAGRQKFKKVIEPLLDDHGAIAFDSNSTK